MLRDLVQLESLGILNALILVYHYKTTVTVQYSTGTYESVPVYSGIGILTIFTPNILLFPAVLWIRIRMFLGFADPDP